jgi:hypothetical protein
MLRLKLHARKSMGLEPQKRNSLFLIAWRVTLLLQPCRMPS